MLAAGDQEEALDARILAELDIHHFPPLHARQRVVGVLARDGAGLAPDATVDVDDHAPAGGGGLVLIIHRSHCANSLPLSRWRGRERVERAGEEHCHHSAAARMCFARSLAL